jgi:hypothetical protein
MGVWTGVRASEGERRMKRSPTLLALGGTGEGGIGSARGFFR